MGATYSRTQRPTELAKAAGLRSEVDLLVIATVLAEGWSWPEINWRFGLPRSIDRDANYFIFNEEHWRPQSSMIGGTFEDWQRTALRASSAVEAIPLVPLAAGVRSAECGVRSAECGVRCCFC